MEYTKFAVDADTNSEHADALYTFYVFVVMKPNCDLLGKGAYHDVYFHETRAVSHAVNTKFK